MSFEGQLIHSLQAALNSRPGIWFAVICARWAIFLEGAWVVILGIRAGRRTALQHAAKEAIIAMLIALYSALTLSSMIGRARPFMIESGVLRWIPSPLSLHAFPSAHASAAFALAFAILWTKRRAAIGPLILASLVAFGRVATGVHYLTDVLGGALVGFLAVIIVRLLHAAIRRSSVYREHQHG